VYRESYIAGTVKTVPYIQHIDIIFIFTRIGVQGEIMDILESVNLHGGHNFIYLINGDKKQKIY
jgi:hypothetical protein